MPRTLPVDAPLDRPDFAVIVAGNELPRAQHDDVLRLDVHEEVGRLARATLLVRNWDDTQQDVKHSDTGPFAPGRDIEIRVGYAGELETVFDGVIAGLAGHFRQDAQPLMEVRCRCRGAWLDAARRSRVFEDATDADAASAIAGEYGMTATTGETPAHAALVQWSTSDWAFLAARARALGLACYVRGSDLVFDSPELSGDAPVTLQWGATLLEVEAHQDLAGGTEVEQSAGWDPGSVEAVEAEVAVDATGVDAGARGPTLATTLGEAAWPNRTSRRARSGTLSGGELDAWSQSRVDRVAQRHVYLTGRTRGLPQLRIDSLLALEGLGRRWSGTHYVSAVRHTLDRSGYFTEFQLGLAPSLQAADDDALLPPVQGPVLGVVEDIDDPDGWGRVRVRFPWLDGELPALWARLALPTAGADRGFFFIPEVGDEVVVDFLQGDPRFPVVLGSLWNGRDAPPESLDAATNAVRTIVSRSGHRFTFDDGDDAPGVTVMTAAGHRFTLDDSSGSEAIELADVAGNTLRMDGSGIALTALPGGDVTLEASSGKLSLSCLQLEAKASSQAKVESSGMLDLQAAATLGITGALVKINS